MDVEQIVQTLDGRATLSRYERDELTLLVTSCEERLLQQREPLWVVDDVRSHAYILLDGKLERSSKTHSGRAMQQLTEPGTMLSLSALVNPWPYYSTCVATEKSTLLALSRARFLELFDAREPVAYKLVDAIGEYLVADMRKANERLQDVFGRPAETLMMLRRRIREDSKA